MKKLKIILHSNYFYLVIFLLISISIIKAFIPNSSHYNKKDRSCTGIIQSYNIDGDKLSLTLKAKEKILAIYYFKTKEEKDNFLKLISLGDKLKINGSLKIPTSINYQKYLTHKNIFFEIQVSSYKKLSSTLNPYYKLKNYLYHTLNKNPYLLALILGDKSSISKKILLSYQENGISHLFAISGMHITFFSSLLLKLFKKLKFSLSKSYLLTSFLLIFYLLLTTISPSVIRGTLFFLLFSLNRIFLLELRPLQIYLLTLAITLLINSNFIFDSGFQYSFLISLALIRFSKYLKNSSYCKSLLQVSLISFFISLPLTLYNFYQINFLSIIYNLFYIPLLTFIILPCTLLTLICPYLLPFYNILTYFLETSSQLLNKITIGRLIFPKLSFLIYLIEFILIIFSLKNIFQKKTHFSIIILSLILILHYFYPAYTSSTYLKMIDVGQGDALLFHSKNESILIDTGGKATFPKKQWQQQKNTSSLATTTIIPLLKSQGIKRLKKLIITHGDYDHAGEALTLLENFPVEEILINQGNLTLLEQQLISDGYNIKIAKQNEIITCGDIRLMQLNKASKNENDSSQVYYATYKDINFLLMGDASSIVENNLLASYNLPKIDILKIGHHGSKTSTSKKLLEKLAPAISLISVGENNKFDHPHKEVLNRLKKYESTYYLTSTSGTITIDLDSQILTTDKFH